MKSKLLFFLVLTVGCAAYKTINLANIQLGMSKTEVLAKIGKKPDNVIGSKQYPEGRIDVLQFTKYDMHNAIDERYWLYFLNDTLKQWGRPGDWSKEADKVYEIRVR